jgi:hypothetical protein
MTDQADTPFACNMDACNPEQRERHGQLSTMLRQNSSRVEELEDGFQFQLSDDAELFVQVAEWAMLERLCYPFFDFSLEWPHDEGIRLSITGKDGVKAFAREEFGLAPA